MLDTQWNWSIPRRLNLLCCPRQTLVVSHVPIAMYSFTTRKVHHLVALKTAYIYRVAFYYVGIVKQFFVDYPLRNRMSVYSDDRHIGTATT